MTPQEQIRQLQELVSHLRTQLEQKDEELRKVKAEYLKTVLELTGIKP